MARNPNRIALVTGANKGIGFEIARGIARSGALVLVGARNVQRGEAAANRLVAEGFDAIPIRVDLLDAASVATAAATIEAEYGRLDSLVNNAGIADFADAGPDATSLEIVRRTFETNFFGTFTVTQAMLPLLCKSEAGRIVNVSSTLGSLTLNGDSFLQGRRFLGYNASKAALNMLTVQIAAELKARNIVANSVCPGYVKTDLNGHQGHLTPAEGALEVIRLALLADGGITGQFRSVDGIVPW
jgi:NAD(P)-dependent dehydrogenase (short-subunit alcohol dehydrogenase family)